MTMDKAIELLSDFSFRRGVTFNPGFTDATKLGISALVRIKTLREQNGAANFPLVGETEDETSPVQGEPVPKRQQYLGGEPV